MNPHISALFEYTRERVTEKHIVDFSPGDPGYDSYVRLWTQLYRTGEIPIESEFDLREVIGLTGWDNPHNFDEPLRFRAYRRFTSAVAVVLIHFGNDSFKVRAANYLARDLIVDCDLNEPEHLALVRSVFLPTRDVLAARAHEDEYPFFTLGALILAQMSHDYEEAAKLATKLIADESAVRYNEFDEPPEDPRFLFGLTNYDQLREDWNRLLAGLTNPTGSTDLQLVMDALGEG